MTKSTQNAATTPSPLWHYWRGLSGWNFYFLVKFGLLWAGYLNFHAMMNLVFMAFLLFPLGYLARHHQRRIENAFRLMFLKPRYVKPVGVLRRDLAVRAKSKND